MNTSSITAAAGAAAEKPAHAPKATMKGARISGWLLGLALCAATGAYAASTVDVYKDPG